MRRDRFVLLLTIKVMRQDNDDRRVEGGQRRSASYVSCDSLGEKRHKLVQTDK